MQTNLARPQYILSNYIYLWEAAVGGGSAVAV